jgi:hypothetical protein
MMIYRVCAAAILILTCAGCASDARSSTSGDVADEFLASIETGDAPAACGLIAPKTVRELEFSEGEPCADTLPSLDLPGGGTVEEVEVWGDRAKADGPTDTLFLVEMDAGWRVAAAGCSPGDDGSYDCLLSGS